MKKYVIIGLVVVGIAAAVLAIKPTKELVQHYKSLETTATNAVKLANNYVGLYNVVQSQLVVKTDSLRALNKQVKNWQSEKRALLDDISHLKASLVSTPTDTVYVPLPPQIKPETLDSALIIIEQQNRYITYQGEQLRSLTAINVTQGVIINKQEAVLEKQEQYINEFEALIRQYERRSRRNIAIGTAVGVIIGILL